MCLLTNIHYLKEKKKNVNRELGKMYTRKRDLIVKIAKCEEAKTNLKIRLDTLRAQQKSRRTKK